MPRLFVIVLLSCAVLVLAGCGGPDAPLERTREGLAQLAFEALQSNDLAPLEPILVTADDVERSLAAHAVRARATDRTAAEKRLEDAGGVERVAEAARARARSRFETARAQAAEAFDWEQATFDGLVADRSYVRTEGGVKFASVYFQVRVGDERYVFELVDCVATPTGWGAPDGARFLGRED